jgi:DNA-binding transcriptional MerR regulator
MTEDELQKTKTSPAPTRGAVIHVDFVRGGTRLPAPPASASASTSSTSPAASTSSTSSTSTSAPADRRADGTHVPVKAEEPAPPSDGGRSLEPVTDQFTAKEVERLLALPLSRLRALERAHVVAPSGSKQGKPAYTFQDLIALRAAKELLARKVRLKEVADAITALRQSLPRVTRPLQELRIVGDGRRVVVRAEDGSFEPVTGQMVLDFQVGALRDDVVRVLRPEAARQRSRTAYDLYVKASTLDEDSATFDEAEALYRRALELDPALSIAYTNLGNIRFRRGDEAGAEKLYEEALARDDRQPEAHYNLGYVMLERGAHAEAAVHFERAISRDPRFADAHFNLAMSLEATGERARARAHWKKYLELEPVGTWADIARQHL